MGGFDSIQTGLCVVVHIDGFPALQMSFSVFYNGNVVGDWKINFQGHRVEEKYNGWGIETACNKEVKRNFSR